VPIWGLNLKQNLNEREDWGSRHAVGKTLPNGLGMGKSQMREWGSFGGEGNFKGKEKSVERTFVNNRRKTSMEALGGKQEKEKRDA